MFCFSKAIYSPKHSKSTDNRSCSELYSSLVCLKWQLTSGAAGPSFTRVITYPLLTSMISPLEVQDELLPHRLVSKRVEEGEVWRLQRGRGIRTQGHGEDIHNNTSSRFPLDKSMYVMFSRSSGTHGSTLCSLYPVNKQRPHSQTMPVLVCHRSINLLLGGKDSEVSQT